MMDKRYIVFVYVGVILGVAALIWWTDISYYISINELKLYHTQLQNFVRDQYLFAVLVYIIFFALITMFFIPITVILTIASGFLFGALLGAAYTIIAATLGGVLTFLMVRYSLGAWVQQRYAHELVQFNKLVQEGGANYLLSLQFLPMTPSFFINIFAGMTKIGLWTFIWTTAVGIFPGTVLYTFAGKQLVGIEQVSDIFSFNMMLIFIFLALLAILPIAVKRYKAVSIS